MLPTTIQNATQEILASSETSGTQVIEAVRPIVGGYFVGSVCEAIHTDKVGQILALNIENFFVRTLAHTGKMNG
jgi:diphthamide biosynthesis methyltransferase